uniref:Dysbindin domain containing 2 n=1 Tax=Varanus komodoensis TaxID=61221 RepID=A0A8D2L7R6_VARKO
MENGQRGLDAEQMQQQQLKLRERQRFFEEVFQHDVDFFFPVSHLQIEHRRPPLGSISSMEVNVDMLEQMDMMDLSDQDTVDVFLSCGTEDNNNVTPLLPGMENSHSYARQFPTSSNSVLWLVVVSRSRSSNGNSPRCADSNRQPFDLPAQQFKPLRHLQSPCCVTACCGIGQY